jgi:hypothetical protein
MPFAINTSLAAASGAGPYTARDQVLLTGLRYHFIPLALRP